jgi:rubrerythrin
MSEMADIMASKTFLEVCMGIEGLCAELYHYYSDIYKDMPEASSLWKKTALEEENHKMQFELALRLMSESDFEVRVESLKQAFSIQYKLLKLIDHVKSNKPELMTAVSRALEMEVKLADLHVNTSLKFNDGSIQNLFRSLSEADKEHVTDLQRYQTILNLPYCDMKG